MNPVVQTLLGKLIVSCQADASSPLNSPDMLAAMAKAAQEGGAGGIRACYAKNIRAVKAACSLPVIGVNKVLSGKPASIDRVIITPDLAAAAEIVEAGCDVLGMDFTLRGRTKEDLARLVGEIRNVWPSLPVMADISTLEEGVLAFELGADIVSTTLSGYTMESLKQMNADIPALLREYRETGEIPDVEPDFALIADLRRSVSVPVNAEGRFWEREQAVQAFKEGADMLTVGSAVTAPGAITRRFVSAIAKR